MKFIISRASDGIINDIPIGATPPLPGCVLEKRTKIVHVPKLGDKQTPDDRWVIEINSLEQLMDLARSEEDSSGLMISAKKFGNDLPDIIIYDDYIE